MNPTPELPTAPVEAPKKRRQKRDCRIFDAEGNEVFLSVYCVHCQQTKPLPAFGLRKMADGGIRNQPWCRECRGVTPKKSAEVEVVAVPLEGFEP